MSVKSKFSVIHDLLCASNKKHATRLESFMEFLIDHIFCLFCKINNHITANDQIAATWIRIF